MAEQLIISISGMRGIVGENLTAGVAKEYGCAFGTYLKYRRAKGLTAEDAENNQLSVCIGRDSRPSGEMLKTAMADGLCAVGVDVVDLGLVTTPGVGIMVRELRCDGGVIITASHNPGQYNGIKLLLENSMAPSPEAAGQIRQYYYDKNFGLVESSGCGGVTCNEQSNAIHIEKVLGLVDKETIAAKKFKVVLDSVNGAGGPVTKKLLGELGCAVSAINEEPTGLFAHTPEPTVENMTGLCEAVKAEGAEIGFGQDPDGDRLAIVDENGRYIGEEYTLALAAKYVFGKRSGGAAANLSTSRMLDDVAKKAGGKVYRTAVGEANVAAAMLEHDCIIGGEGNGGVIDLRVSPVRDSLVGIVLVLQLIAETGKSVSQLTGEIGSYYMSKDKFAADKEQAEQLLGSVKKVFADAKLDTTDGCRFDFEDGWLHIRASNTEPVMRIIVEAKDREAAEKYTDAVLEIRTKIIG
ncbi:MAG: phosphoglucosamine mutase [Planctomycetota bacterium]|jgi:phosphomannomutase